MSAGMLVGMLSTAPTPRPAFSRWLPTLLLLLTVFGPISMDLYLPALPALTVELDAATSVAQLTVTACLIGLAAGQLIAGPLSDRFGRRGILLIGIIAYIVTSALCAISPTVELLIVARFVQGLTGGVGIVIAQAAGRDITSGGALIRFYGRLTVIGGFAAIVGPLLGGMLNTIADWRGLFVYLAGATYVLQEIYGLSPQEYALAFGLNSAGFMVFGYLAGRAAERWSVPGTLTVGIAVAGVGAAGLLASGLTVMPLWVVIVSLFALASGVAITSPPATTLALVEYPRIAGTASSLLGTVRFGFGGVAAPLVGVAGAASILPLGLVTVTAVVLAGAAYLVLGRRRVSAAATEAEPVAVPAFH